MRILKFFLLVTALLCLSNIEMESQTLINRVYNEGVNITPAPLEQKMLDGKFILDGKVCFIAQDENARKIAEFFASKLKLSTGYGFEVSNKPRKKGFIQLKLNNKLKIGNEGYHLLVTPNGVKIESKSPHGLFNGMQSVLQLLPAEIESSKIVRGIDWAIPCISLKDAPRFSHRGILFDVCRHFLDVNFLKKQIDVMAMFKINKLHWHLTDDQAWRIEIKRYPKLTGIASKRVDQAGMEYGPYFYTQEQIKDVVAYAKERFIEVIPEIEFPGHAVAALTAYSEYSCTGGPFKVRTTGGVSGDVFCAGNEDVFSFLEDVLDEVAPLFESEYIHIGGDEAPKVRWEKCLKCQKKINELGLQEDSHSTTEGKLQSYFIQRMEKYLLSKHNRKIIGWDEILEGGLEPTATIMSWRGEKNGIAAANAGHDVIMTPGQWLYVDKYQSDSKIYPLSMSGYVPLQKTYSYDPMPDSISADKKHHIIGLQVNMWAEHAYKPIFVENRLYPRAVAMAEIGWSSKENKSYDDFLRRIENGRVRLDMHEIAYYIPIPEQKTPSCNFVAFVEKTTLDLKTTEPVKMVYTINGTDPNLLSEEYTEALTFTESCTFKVRSILASGKMGDIRTIDIVKQSLQPSVEIEDKEQGLDVAYYGGLAWKVSDVDSSKLIEKVTVATPHQTKYYSKRYYEVADDQLFNTVIGGYINIPEDDVYYFSSEADHVWIGNSLVINNEGDYKRFSRADKSIALAKGLHQIKIIRVSGTYGGWSPLWNKLELSMRPSEGEKFKLMDASCFFRKR